MRVARNSILGVQFVSRLMDLPAIDFFGQNSLHSSKIFVVRTPMDSYRHSMLASSKKIRKVKYIAWF